MRPAALPDDDLPITAVLDAKARRFKRIRARQGAERWTPVPVADDKPIGVMWFGDPHLDDDACNLPLLRDHVALCRKTPGLYGVNIGDVTNNWTGRLLKKYADQSMSARRARKAAEWFMHDAGVKWLFWLLGNHDAWEHGGEILTRIGRGQVVMADWEARVKLCFPKRVAVRVHAAHDFKGSSIWNIGHGPMREAMFGSDADVLVCGHRHTGIVTQFEHAGRPRTVARVRGYKWVDGYARRHGFPQTEYGASIMTIIDPRATGAARVMPFADPVVGARVLAALRKAK